MAEFLKRVLPKSADKPEYKQTMDFNVWKALIEGGPKGPEQAPMQTEQVMDVGEPKKEQYFSIGVAGSILPAGVFPKANPRIAFTGTYVNPYYDLYFEQYWVMGVLDQYFPPPYYQLIPSQVGFAAYINDTLIIPQAIYSPFPTETLNDPWLHYSDEWLQVLAEPIRIRSGDRIQIRLYSDFPIQVEFNQNFMGYYIKR